jgi:hypothetical protein
LAARFTWLGFLRSAIRGKPRALRHKFTVFFISIVMVIGPTPPGTGVMNEHFGAT